MEGLNANERGVWSGWEGKSPREVVREAASKGTHIHLAKRYLMHTLDWSEQTSDEWFQSEVLAWVLQLLQRKQIFKVLHVLTKIKLNPDRHLLNLARESREITFRDYLIEQLIKSNSTFKEENENEWKQLLLHWNLLKYLEKSFESEGTFKQNKVFGCGSDMVVVTETEIKGLTIEKIEGYPDSWKKKIAAYLFFDSFEFSLLDFLTPLSIWNHLIDHNKSMVLVRWINMHISELVRDKNARYIFFSNDNFVKKLLGVDTRGLDQDILDKLDDKFREFPITDEMIRGVATRKCFAYTKMCIYDTLSSYGIIIDDEKQNIYAIVSRLARTQNLRIIDDIFQESCATISKRDFYVEVAKYCVKNKLYNALTVCVDGDVIEDNLDGVEEEARGCIELWLQFKSIEQTSDRQSHVLPIYNTCEQIANKDIENYISRNPHLVLGMVLLDDNKQLFDIFTTEPSLEFEDFILPPSGCKEKLPHLMSVYEKYKDKSCFSTENDVNVYQLLSGYRGLDVSKVFEFQFTNHNQTLSGSAKSDRRSLGSLLTNGVDLSADPLPNRTSEIPHFANAKLMKRYGYVAKLNHMYYLKQNRPCTASQAFMRQQYQTYNRLQDQSIKNACCEAHALALENWDNPTKTASAIAFMTMIGCTASRCRTHISAAKMIKAYMMECETISEDIAVRHVNELMMKLCQNSESVSQEVLAYLEKITQYNIEKKTKPGGQLDMATILYEWQTAVKFAMLQGLPYPEVQLRAFVKKDLWFPFLLFGDVFRYSQHQMLTLSQEFQSKPYAEHLKHVILHKTLEDISVSDKDSIKSNAKDGQRRVSRLSSVETSPTHSGSFDFPEVVTLSNELWEVLSVSHMSEDPPGALIRAAGTKKAPILALVATCYEPNAVGLCWAYWILSTLGDALSPELRDSLQWDVTEQFTEADFRQLTQLCVKLGRVRSLHESMLIFFPDSAMTQLTAFLYRTIWQLTFDQESTKLIHSFTRRCQRKYSKVGADLGSVPWLAHAASLQAASVALVCEALAGGFSSAYHQKLFLKCLVDAHFGKDFSESSPDFAILHSLIKISMETSSVIDVSKVLEKDSTPYLFECIDNFIQNRKYDIASRFAKTCDMSVDNILIAQWSYKYEELSNKEENITDKDITLFIAQCSEAFKKSGVTFSHTTNFLITYAKEVKNLTQKYYAYRIILSWFEDNFEYGTEREMVEHQMWDAYLNCEDHSDIFVSFSFATLHFILSGQKDLEIAKKMGEINSEIPFSKSLSEIEVESDARNIAMVEELDDFTKVERWRKAISKLLELKLMVEAFRLARLFDISKECLSRSPCPVQLVKTCLTLAESSCSPYELPQDLRMVISSAALSQRTRLSASQASETDFEELVMIPEETDEVPESASQLAGRKDADRLSALEALAARSGITVAKQVASFYRIALQIGWSYSAILKYQGNPVDFINYVSGRARMSLAHLVFRTYNISSKQIAEYLCLEMVTAIISPHLVKTSTFRQKEHFQYTLWGYPLSSDIEMFINMRPDACSLIGRFMLDHLMAFRRIYKSDLTAKLPENVLDDSSLDLDTLIDEEYQTVEHDEFDSITNSSEITDRLTNSSVETESIFSEANTVLTNSKRESRRNLFDVISKSNVHIPYEVKANIRKITKGAKLSTKQVNVISIELLVLAHSSFSGACDTEGIAVVLRSAQALSAHLLAARSWRLLVRLLTGLARYTEMAYVFQMLRDNHQFEFLLGQFDYMLGSKHDQITEFKQGLLDFLKQHCPADTETYCMVALHFSMHAEAADVKRKQAADLVVALRQVALDAAGKPAPQLDALLIHDNSSTRLLLETALHHSTAAASLYLQGGCLNAAREMASRSQLIALQLATLVASPARFILALDRDGARQFALTSKLMEGLVLMSAHEGGAAEWRDVCYRRVARHDKQFMRELATHRPDVAADILHRYKTEKTPTASSQAAITELKSLLR